MKEKYNIGVPIDIDKLSDEERKVAFHEWAEGSEALEQLLNEGYENGFLSHACCGGDTGNPYISYELNDEESRKMAMAVAGKLVDSNLDCQVTIYDNFLLNESDPKQYPTKDIISLNVQTKMENREEVFKAMSKSIKEAELDKVKLPQTEEEIPKKKFKKTIEEAHNERTNAATIENKFVESLKSKTYTKEEVVKNDVKIVENPATEQPVVQSPVTQGPEMVI